MRFAFRIQQNVSRFDVSMQNAVFMRVMHGAGHLRDEFGCLPKRHCPPPNDFVKLASFNKLHAEVARAITLADFVNWNDTGMLQAGCSFGFPAKAFHVRSACPFTELNDH
jgi:hypothetical protein